MGGPGTPARRAGLPRLASCAVAIAWLTLGGFACGSEDKKAGPSPRPARRADPGPVQMSSLYAPTAKGLTKMTTELLAALENGNARGDTLVASLVLPAHDAWFKHTFGEERGVAAAKEYAPQSAGIGQMKQLLRTLIAAGQTTVTVERFDSPNDPASIGYQNRALGLMKQRTPLYSVRLVKPGQRTGFHLWSFVYHKSGFRWVGRLRALSDAPPAPGTIDRNLLRLRDAARLRK